MECPSMIPPSCFPYPTDGKAFAPESSADQSPLKSPGVPPSGAPCRSCSVLLPLPLPRIPSYCQRGGRGFLGGVAGL